MTSHARYGFRCGVVSIGIFSVAGCNQLIGFKDVSVQGDAAIQAAKDASIDTVAQDAMKDGPPPKLFVFMTDQTSDGGFGAAGARNAADQRCTAKYNLAFTSLGCTEIHAVIQIDDTADSLARMKLNFPTVPLTTEVKRATDMTPVIGTWDALIDPNTTLLSPISAGTPPQLFWSGRAGASGTNLQCANWTSADNAQFGTAGDATKTSQWTVQKNSRCDDIDEHLVCACW
jgi:hypothetical protein